MNLLFCVQANIRKDMGGYYDNNVAAFVARYKKHCAKLTCLCSVYNEDKGNHLQIDADGVNMVNIINVNSLKRILCDEKKNNPVVEQAVKGADACIIHLPSRIGEMTIKYAKKYNKPYLVVVVSCVWDSYWYYNLKGRLIAPISFLSTRRAIYNASDVIYVTDKFLQSRYPTKGRSIGCSNVRLPDHSAEILERKLNIIEELQVAQRVIKLSTLAAVDVPYKGQSYVIRAIAKLKERGNLFEYHIAGMGDPSNLLKLAKDLNVEKELVIHGVISHNKISEFIDETDIYIQPSKQEGLPRAVIEAMSRACPVLGSNIAGIPELIEDDFLFQKGSVNEICRKLIEFTADKMKVQAIRNFEFSKKYNQITLNHDRDEFISEFISNAIRS